MVMMSETLPWARDVTPCSSHRPRLAPSRSVSTRGPATVTHHPDRFSDWGRLQATASGERECFEALVVKYERMLRFLILRRGAYLLDFADLEEIINETWCQVLRRAMGKDIPARVKFSAWLTGVCLNVLKQRALRPAGTNPTVRAGDREGAVADPPDPVDGPDELAARLELLAALKDCLAERTDAERQVYELIYVQEHTKVSAARELGCAESYVRQKLLPRLHQALARCLARKGFRDVPFGAP